MSKKWSLLIVVLVLILIASTLVTNISPINALEATLRINNPDGTLKKEVVISDHQVIDEINAIITSKIYYRQPYIDGFSRNEVDYEIRLFEHAEGGGQLLKWYKIAINKDEPSNNANRSRVDILRIGKTHAPASGSTSLALSDQQWRQILKTLEPYIK